VSTRVILSESWQTLFRAFLDLDTLSTFAFTALTLMSFTVYRPATISQKYRSTDGSKIIRKVTRNHTTSRTHLSSLTSTTISFTSSEEGRRRSLRKPQTTFQRHLKPQPLSFPCGGTLPDSANAHPLRTLPQGKSERRKRKNIRQQVFFFFSFLSRGTQKRALS
jgi:hypothetical protein